MRRSRTTTPRPRADPGFWRLLSFDHDRCGPRREDLDHHSDAQRVGAHRTFRRRRRPIRTSRERSSCWSPTAGRTTARSNCCRLRRRNTVSAERAREPRRLGVARLERCITAAKGDLLVRLDCHSRYPPGLSPPLRASSEETGALAVGGIIVAEGRTPLERAVACAMDSPFGGIGFYRVFSSDGSLARRVAGVFGIPWARDATSDSRVETDTVTFGAFRPEAIRARRPVRRDIASKPGRRVQSARPQGGRSRRPRPLDPGSTTRPEGRSAPSSASTTSTGSGRCP